MTIYLKDSKGQKVKEGDIVSYKNELYLVVKHPQKNLLGVQFYEDNTKCFDWFDISETVKVD